MTQPKLSIIVAMDENRLIGRDGDLPWRLPNDLAHFKRTTMGKPMLMGRKTWESLPGRLPGRRHLVLTRDSGFEAEGAESFSTVDDAQRACQGEDELMVIGGGQIYASLLPQVSVLYLTRVHASLQGDTWFPEIDWSAWQLQSREHQSADERNSHDHSFELWVRKSRHDE